MRCYDVYIFGSKGSKINIELLDQLILDLRDVLAKKFNYSQSSIFNKGRIWNDFREFLISNPVPLGDERTLAEFLEYKFGNCSRPSISISYVEFYKRNAQILIDFSLGKVDFLTRKRPITSKEKFNFGDQSGHLFNEYFIFKKTINQISDKRIQKLKRDLFPFYLFLNEEKIKKPSKISGITIIKFFRLPLTDKTAQQAYSQIMSIRGFLKFLHHEKHTKINLAETIRSPKKPVQKLPDTYSEDELKLILESVDRSSAIGKRNYAMLTISAFLGLRASDIHALRFDEIDWDNSNIYIRQIKTERENILPLLPEIGNAILDYAKNGRPITENPHIFVAHRPPYTRFVGSTGVYRAVSSAIHNSKIEIKKRRKGSHALRHSLATNMLAMNIDLPIISESLGHASMNTTRNYVRIDLKSLLQCALEVPPIKNYE